MSPGRTLLVSLILVLVCATHAQQPKPSASGTGRIAGKVVDARSGQPLARCVVEINPSSARTQSLSTSTGEDGQFAFAGLQLGKYRLTAARRGYLTQSYQQHESFFTAIAVGPNLPSEGLIFNLMPQAVVYGVVTDETGEPIRNAQVRLFEDQHRGGLPSIQGRQVAITDDRGMYEMADIAPANYFLAVSAQAWYAQRLTPSGTGNTQAGEVDSSLDVAYPTTYYPNATDSDQATPIPVKGGERIQVDMTLTAQHALRLRLPLPQGNQIGYSVSLAQYIFGEPEQVPAGMQCCTDGFMEVIGLLPGRYDVTVTLAAAGPRPESHFTAEVAAGATELREESGAGEGTVTGKVISLESKIPAGSISLTSTHPFRRYPAGINPAGEFSMSVPAGEYEIAGHIPQYYLAAISSPDAPVKGRMLQVKAGAVAKLEIVAGTGYGQIDGWAELAGQRVSGVMIVLAPEDAKDNHILFRRDQSDSDGSFSLLRIIPGRYRLLAIANGWDLDWADPGVLDVFEKKSIPIVIHASERLKETVEVQAR